MAATTYEAKTKVDIYSTDNCNASYSRCCGQYHWLRTLPVIDEQGNLQGIITFDDALDVLLPESLRECIGHLFTYRRDRAVRL